MESTSRDDRILPITRIVFGVLALVVFPVFARLAWHPENTAHNFAWPLAPRVSALVFAMLYLAVAYTYVRVAFERCWRRVYLVVAATLPVIAVLGVVSIVHWDKFTSAPLRIGVWSTAYFVFPPILSWMLFAHRGRDDGRPEPKDVFVPLFARRAWFALGVVFAGLAAAMILAPETMAQVWPWSAKPLAARGVGALFLAPAAVQLRVLHESRWSALRLPCEFALIWFTGMFVSFARCWDEIDRARPGTWTLFGLLAVELGLVAWMYLSLESRRRAQRALTTA